MFNEAVQTLSTLNVLTFKVFSVMFNMILEISCNEIIAVVISFLLSQNDRYPSFHASCYEVVRQKLPILQKLIFFALECLKGEVDHMQNNENSY